MDRVKNEQTGSRDSFLSAAISEKYVPSGTALLWLFDPIDNTLHLDRVKSSEHVFEQLQLVKNCSIQLRSSEESELRQAVQPANCSFLTTFISKYSLPTNSAEFTLIDSVSAKRGIPVGLLQILAPVPISKQVKFTLEFLALSLANVIITDRNLRVTECLSTIHRGIDTTQYYTTWFKDFSLIIQKITRAELVIVFDYIGSGNFRLYASTQNPSKPEQVKFEKSAPLFQVFTQKKAFRLRDFSDKDERLRVFNTDKICVPLQSWIEAHFMISQKGWMAVPIVREKRSIGMILVSNKVAHLNETFTHSDLQIATQGAGFLAEHIPSSTIYAAADRFTRIAATHPENDFASKRSTLFDELISLLPTAIYCAFAKQTPATDWVVEATGLHDAILPNNHQTFTDKAFSAFSTNIGQVSVQTIYKYCEIRPDTAKVKVFVGFNDSVDSDWELAVCEIFSKIFVQTIVTETQVEKRFEEIIQLRHAIKSGLEGLHHLPAAIQMVEFCQRKNYVGIANTMEHLLESLILSNNFLLKTKHLLEQARLIHVAPLTKKHLRKGVFDLATLIGENVHSLRPRMRKRHLNIVDQLAGSIEKVTADKDLFEIVVFNLLENAYKYSYQNRTITVSFKRKDNAWFLRVGNTGMPILEEDFDAIFKPFDRRLHHSQDSSRPGTGLGLTIVKQIVEAHGGNIVVRCDLEKDENGEAILGHTQFSVKIPTKS